MDTNLIRRAGVKRQTSPEKFLGSTIIPFDHIGKDKRYLPKFDRRTALSLYYGIVATAIQLNAKGAARTPLRLYINEEYNEMGYQTRKVSPRVKRYLCGELPDTPWTDGKGFSIVPNNLPHSFISRKAMEWRDNLAEVTDPSHPVLRILSSYRDTMERFIQLQISGDMFTTCWCSEDTGHPVKLFVMKSHRVWALPSLEDGPTELLRGWQYGKLQDVEHFFELDEVGHAQFPHPDDDYLGMGLIEANYPYIKMAESQDLMDLALWQNNCRMDGMLVIDGTIPDAEAERIKEEIQGNHMGPQNAGKMIFMRGANKATWVPFQFRPKDMAGREELMEKLAFGLGISLTMIKATEANYSNYSQGALSHLNNTVIPMLRVDEEWMNEWLLDQYDIGHGMTLRDVAFLAYDNPVGEDRLAEANLRISKVNAGLMTINTAADEEGLPHVEGGDIPRFNGVPLNLIGRTQTEAGTVQPVSGYSLSGQSLQPIKDAVVEAVKGVKIRDRKNKSVDISGILAAVDKLSAQVKALADKLDQPKEAESKKETSTELAEIIADYLTDCRQAAIDALAGLAVEKSKPSIATKEWTYPDLAKAINELTEQLRGEIADTIKDLLARSAVEALTALKVDPEVFNVTNPHVVEFMDNYVVRLATELGERVENELSQAIARGLEAGENIRELEKRINETPGFDDQGIADRANMIARTESARALEEGQIQGWRLSGVVEGKEWLLSANSCWICKELAKRCNQETMPLDGVIAYRGETITGPGGETYTFTYEDIRRPPAHPHCECDLIPKVRASNA